MSYDPSIIFRAPSLSNTQGLLGPIEINTSQAPLVSTMFSPNDFKNNDITFPPDVVESVKHSYASFSREQLIPITKEFSDYWELVVPVGIPDDFNRPRLLSVEYTLKYATIGDKGNSTLQTDLVLTTASLSSGIHRLERHGHAVYRDMDNEYSPRTINKDNPAWNLVTSVGIKPKGGQQGWSHYMDHQRTTLKIDITRPSQLYFILNVIEYPSLQMLRSVGVEITTKWQDVPRPNTSHEKTPIVAANVLEVPPSLCQLRSVPVDDTTPIFLDDGGDDDVEQAEPASRTEGHGPLLCEHRFYAPTRCCHSCIGTHEKSQHRVDGFTIRH